MIQKTAASILFINCSRTNMNDRLIAISDLAFFFL